MDSQSLLASVRSLVDESVSSFWLDSEIYSWLSDGQREIINLVLGVYKAKLEANPQTQIPDILIPLQEVITGTATSGVHIVPADYLYLVSMLFDSFPCFIKRYGEKTTFESFNTYLKGTSTNPIVTIIGDPSTVRNFMFTPLITATYQGVYLRMPADFGSTTVEDSTIITQPLLPDQARNAMIQFAYSRALLKDQATQESIAAYQQFLQMVQSL